MPYEVDSPLGVGLSTAAAFLTGREQRRQQRLLEQQTAEQNRQQAALTAAQSKYYEAGASEREAQASKLIAILPYLPQEEGMKVAKFLMDGNVAAARATAQNALAGKYQAETKLVAGPKTQLTKAQATKAAVDAATEKSYRQSQITKNLRAPVGRGGGGGTSYFGKKLTPTEAFSLMSPPAQAYVLQLQQGGHNSLDAIRDLQADPQLSAQDKQLGAIVLGGTAYGKGEPKPPKPGPTTRMMEYPPPGVTLDYNQTTVSNGIVYVKGSDGKGYAWRKATPQEIAP